VKKIIFSLLFSLIAVPVFSIEILTSQVDKQAHMLGGALIAKYCHDDFKMDKSAAAATVTAISLAKEFLDGQAGGSPDPEDVAYTLFGAACVYIFEDHVRILLKDDGFSIRFNL
jgi:hypothetical protein